MKKLIQKIKGLITVELITYFICGCITTLINFVTFWLLNKILGERFYLFNNIVSWVVGVTFAFISNKLLVFRSKSKKPSVVFKEASEFIGARVLSLAIDEGGLWFFVEILNFDRFGFTLYGFEISGKLIAKLALTVIVVILNYLFSKFVIFKKQKSK